MTNPILPFIGPEASVSADDIACGSSDNPLNFVSDEDPDHDPFTDYPVVADPDSDSVDDDDTESGNA